MRNKLLYFLITLFGAATLVSGYLWGIEIKDKRLKIENYAPEKEIVDETQTSPQTKQKEIFNLQSSIFNLQQIEKIPINTSSDEIVKLAPDEPIFEAKVTLQINNKNFPIPYEEDMTAEDVMKEVRSRYPESFSYESIEYGGDLGTFVKSINGIAENNREKMYWILYINGKKSNKGISILKLKPDDIIMWNYEKEIL